MDNDEKIEDIRNSIEMLIEIRIDMNIMDDCMEKLDSGSF